MSRVMGRVVTGLELAAERLTEQWAAERETKPEPAELDLARYVLRELADPTSDHGALLEDLCQRRWTVGVVSP